MHPALRAIESDFHRASSRVDALAEEIPFESWTHRVDPRRWSVAECVDHLNRTSAAFLPEMERALAEARLLPPRESTESYRPTFVGRLMTRLMSARMQTRTSAPFTPERERSPEGVRAEFRDLQEELLILLARADGAAMDRVRIVSPFSSSVRYDLYSAFRILVAHQHRHLAQAERVHRV